MSAEWGERVVHKLNWRFHFWWVFLTPVVLLGARVITMLLSGEVSDEDGRALPAVFCWIVSAILSVVLLSYLSAVLVSLVHLFRHHGVAFRLSETGVEDTLVVLNLLAFVFILPVRCIPWHAVRYIDTDDGVNLRLRRKEIDAGWLTRMILWILGYGFCHGMIKPRLTAGEIERIKQYCAPYAEDLSLKTLLDE